MVQSKSLFPREEAGRKDGEAREKLRESKEMVKQVNRVSLLCSLVLSGVSEEVS